MRQLRRSLTILSFLLALPFAAQAQSTCTSDGAAQPVAVLERFTNADCEACWQDPKTPKAGAREIALDWIVPGSKGDDAPLALGASSDALQRLESLGRKPPLQADALRTNRVAGGPRLRVAQGQPFNDYIGASIELTPAAPVRGWLLLVESLPAGAEGSPVPRNLVRNVFRPDWAGVKTAKKALYEVRPMQIHEGAKPARLRLVGLVEDTRGRLVAAVRSVCPK